MSQHSTAGLAGTTAVIVRDNRYRGRYTSGWPLSQPSQRREGSKTWINWFKNYIFEVRNALPTQLGYTGSCSFRSLYNQPTVKGKTKRSTRIADTKTKQKAQSLTELASETTITSKRTDEDDCLGFPSATEQGPATDVGTVDRLSSTASDVEVVARYSSNSRIPVTRESSATHVSSCSLVTWLR